MQGILRVVLVLGLVWAGAASAEGWDRLRTAVFERLGREQGMPHPSVSALLQDSEGFVWVGTQGGLARFDGQRFKSFVHREGDPESLPGDFILALSVDGAGRVWVGTASGDVAYYDKRRDAFRSFPESAGLPARGSGLKLIGDGDGVWVASSNTGLERIDGSSGAITRYSHRDGDPASLPSDRVRSLFLDRGDLWVGTYWGLVRRARDGQGFEPVPIVGGHDRPFEDMVVGMTAADDGHVWFVTAQSGIGRIEPAGPGDPRLVGRILPGQAPEVTGGPLSLALTEAVPGEMWVSRVSGGIAAIDMASGKARLIQHDPSQSQSLADDTVRALIRDRSGLVWAGTNHGLCWTDPRSAVVDTVLPSAQPGGLTDGDIFGIAAADGRAWLGLKEHGVVTLDPASGTLTPIPGAAQIAGDGIVDSLSAGPDGALWIAAGNGRALYRYDPRSQALDRHPFPRVNNEARRMLAQVWAEGELWFAAGGLLRYDPATDSFRTYRHGLDVGTLIDDSANAIQLAEPGSLWVGTQRGLDRFDIASGHFRHLSYDPAEPGSLPGNYITGILVDRRGRLWVATLSGLGVADHANAEVPSFRLIGTDEGLPSANVDALREDGQGRIWVSTADGLAVIDPDTLRARPLGTGGAAVSAYWMNSAAALPDGTMLFGGLGGFSVVHPDRLAAWSFRPPVVITELRVDGRVAPGRAADGALVLGSTEKSFEVQFAALDYSAPDRLRYAYRLEGFDRDWISADPQRRVAAYTNLAPGRYSLLIRGSNRDGVWSDTLTLPVEVRPAWWQSWWFRAMALLAGVVAVVAVVHLRTAVLRRRREELEGQVAEQTRELIEANQRLEELAARDALTGLYNRRHFLELAERELERARRAGHRTSLLLIDIDHFKRVNDTQGHEAGDDVLRGVCARLAASLRDADILARLGGEELAVLAPETDPAAALVVAERLRQSVASGPYAAGEAKLVVTVSLGAATVADPAEPLKSLMGRADKALYVAKAGGRNRVAQAVPPA